MKILLHSQIQYKPTDIYMNKIIKIEDVQDSLQKINEELKFNLKFKHLNNSTYQEQQQNIYTGNMKPKKIETLYPYSICPYFMYYSPKNLRLIQLLYQIDIKAYNYEIPKEIVDFIKMCGIPHN